jgi:outer membrane receptor protein involved in Fe transport
MNPFGESPLRFWAAFVLVLLLSVAMASGQVITGTLVGTVRDASGSVIPKAKVTAVLTDRNLERTVETNGDGDYAVPFLPAGTYTVTVTMAGFETVVKTGVDLRIDQRARTDFALTVGTVSQMVTVNGGAVPLLATDSSNIGDTLERSEVAGVPLKGRQFIELVLLSAGVTPEIPGQTGGQFDLAGSSVNVNGNRSDSNNFLLDGVPINDSMWGRMAISPSVDAIGEMKVQSFLYSAEFGSAGGGQINITLRSGQNQFHGAGFGFFRRDTFDARNYFAPTKPALTQNDYGFSFGGPVLRNKFFFFSNFERLTTLSGFTLVSTLPNANLRSGNFTGLAPVIDPTTGLPFALNQIPAGRINSVSQAVLALIPTPAPGAPATNNFSTVENENFASTQGTIKLDYQMTAKDLFSGHFSIADLSGNVPAAGTPPGFTPTVIMNTRTIGAQWVRTLGAKSVNAARFGYTYSTSVEPSAHPNEDFAAQNGILGTSHNAAVLGIPRFTITGYSVIGDLTSTLNGTTHDYHFIDDFSHTLGTHSLKVGGIVSWLKPSPLFYPSPRGNYSYLGGYTNSPFADFLLGLPTTGSVGVGNPQLNARAWRIGGYIQDDWRASSRLTVNLGLRYEILTPPTEINNKLSNLDLSTGHIIVACNGGQPSSAANLSMFPQFTFVCNNTVGLGRGLTKADTADWGPRLGLSYSPSNSIVVRAGYGIFYSYPPMAVRIGTPSFSIPFFSQTTATNSKTSPVNTQNFFTVPGLNAFAGQPFSRDYLAGRVQQWSVDLQKQLGTRLLDIAYIGSYGTNLDAEELPNQAVPGPGAIATRTPFPLLANNLILSGPFAYSNYNALQARFEQRAWHGLSMAASYTYGKSLDDASNLLSNNGDSGVPQNSRDIQAEYARSNFDVRNRFTANGLYELPVHASSHLMQALAGGWGLGATAISQGNMPMSPVEATDVSGTGAFMDRPNQISNPNAHAPHTPQKWFNTAAFQQQAPGTFGNTPRNTIYGPDYNDLDAAIIKHVAVTESQNLELRIEAFNVLNHTNFLQPTRTFGSPTFGVISAAQDPRVMQWGVKYLF